MDLDNFIALGQTELTPYLGQLDNYLEKLDRTDLSQHDDLELLESSPEKYIRNMLVVGVLNRICRDEFLKTKKKLIVVPECLKDYGPDICCRRDFKNHSECTECQPDCHINLISEAFVDNKTEMILEPDDTELMAAKLAKKKKSIGIVGVACVLTLVQGFKNTLKYKHPTQGIFLNYASCKHHWAPDKPYNTRFSMERLGEILNKPAPQQNFDPPISGETYSLETQPGDSKQFYKLLDDLAGQFVVELLPTYQKQDSDIYETCLKIIDDMTGDK